jgi:hypothetical protein
VHLELAETNDAGDVQDVLTGRWAGGFWYASHGQDGTAGVILTQCCRPLRQTAFVHEVGHAADQKLSGIVDAEHRTWPARGVFSAIARANGGAP